jgi:glycosyltransferase involved in cell wall biosynthesis
MCRRLPPAFEVAVCCLDEAGAWGDELVSDGVTVVALRRRPGFRPELGRRIAQLAAEGGFDVLHCHQYSPFVYGRIATWWKPRLRLVYTEHGRLSDAPPSWKRRLVNPVLGRFNGAVVAVSDELRGYLTAARFPARRVSVIHNGIEVGPKPSLEARHRARHLLGLNDDAFIVMSAARLDPVKDFVTLIDAFAAVRPRIAPARLVIIGDGPEREPLVRHAASCGLTRFVDLIGFRGDVRALLPAADVYVNSSISEGVSITILEAMAAALPVVATEVGGTPEVLAGGSAGILVPPRDRVGLASALAALAWDPVQRAALGAEARRRVESSFTIERMVDEYARTYERLLRRVN